MEMQKISFNASEISDRREVFQLICGFLNIDMDAQATKMKMSSTGQGYNITPDHLFSFCFLNGVKLESYDEKTHDAVILSHELPSTGKTAMNNPETINSTSVDDIKEEEIPEIEENADPPEDDNDDDEDELPF